MLYGRLLLVLVALAGAFYFASKGVSLVRHYDKIIRTAYEAKGPPEFPEAGDVTVFYTAGRVIVSDERSRVYDSDYFIPQVFKTQGWPPNDIFAGDGAWSKFYNPPFFALVLSPLTLFDLHTAYLIVLGVNLAAGALLLYLLGRIMRWQQPATVLLALGLFSFTPLYFVFQHAQPSLLLAVVLASSFLFMDAGAYRPGALMLIFAGLKPQWLALPTAVLAQRDRRSLLWFAFSGLSIIAVPFLLVGWRGISDYIGLVLDRGSGDISDQQFSSAILSWSGFVRALTGQPQPVLWGLMAAVTVVVFIIILANRDTRLSTAGSIIATLLVIPHSHPQDWVVVAVAGAIALGRRAPFLSHLVTSACLLAIYFAANDWPHESYRVSIGLHTVYWITPAAACLLAWFGLAPVVESRIAAAPAPSMWRFEWQSVQAFRVRAWQAAGLTFSVGIVVGISLALALVKGPDLSGFSLSPANPPPVSGVQTGSTAPLDPRFPQAEPAVSSSARASSGWAFSARGAQDRPFDAFDIPAAAVALSNPASDFAWGPADAPGASGSAPVQQVLSTGGLTEIAAPESGLESAVAGSRGSAGEENPVPSQGDAFQGGELPAPFDLALPDASDALALGSSRDDSAAFDAAMSRQVVLMRVASGALNGVVGSTSGSARGMQALRQAMPEAHDLSTLGSGAWRVASAVDTDQRAALSASKQQAGLLDGTSGGRAEKPVSVPAAANVAHAEAVSELTAGSASAGLRMGAPGTTSTLGSLARDAGTALLRAGGLGLPRQVVPSTSGSVPPGPGARPALDLASSSNADSSSAPAAVTTLDVAAGVARLIQDATSATRKSGSVGGDVPQAQVVVRTAGVRAALRGWSTEKRSLASLAASLDTIEARRADKRSTASQVNQSQKGLMGTAAGSGRLAAAAGSFLSVPSRATAPQAIRALFLATGENVALVQEVRNKAFVGAELQYQARIAQAARSAEATQAALAARPTVTATRAPDRTDCSEIIATGPRTPGESSLLASRCAPTPAPTLAAPTEEPPPPPPTPAPEVRAAAPPPPPPPPPSSRCTRAVVARAPSLVALPEGGFRLDAEIAATEPAGCSEWPAAFSASASISVTSGSSVYQGTWNCDSGRNSTAGVPSSTRFAFFCTIGVKAGPPAGSAFFNITVTALSESGAVIGTSTQSFPAPSP